MVTRGQTISNIGRGAWSAAENHQEAGSKAHIKPFILGRKKKGVSGVCRGIRAGFRCHGKLWGHHWISEGTKENAAKKRGSETN